MSEQSALDTPNGYKRTGEFVMTNFDHTIDRDCEWRLRAERVIMHYAGWHFCGDVWFADNRYHCLVFQRHIPQEIISADTLDEIMSEVCDKYGTA